MSRARLIIMNTHDARVYLDTAQKVSRGDDVANAVRRAAGIIASNNTEFVTRQNILQLLIYVLPVTFKVREILPVARILFETDGSVDLEEALNQVELDIADDAAVKSAHDLVAAYVGFPTDDPPLVAFVKAKAIQLSSFYDINELAALFDEDHPALNKWYRSVVGPFTYYWIQWGVLRQGARFNTFVELDASQQLATFVEPLNDNKVVVEPVLWMENVVVPHLGSDPSPLASWMFASTGHLKYLQWYHVLSVLTVHYELAQYKDVLKGYIAAVYYDAVNEGALSPVATTRLYDTIFNTLRAIESTIGSGHVIDTVDYNPSNVTATSLDDFIDHCQLGDLLNPTADAVTTLRETVATCQRLYSLNKLTIAEYLELRYSHAKDFALKEKEVVRMLNGLTLANHQQLLEAAQLFSTTFIAIDDEHAAHVNRLIVERFLFHDLYDTVLEFYTSHKFPLSDDTYFELVHERFWDVFNQASNLNEKLGRLRLAVQCVDLFDAISQLEQLSENNRNTIIKIKHLMKAISTMKNFKIVAEAGTPFTPSQLVGKFTESQQGPLTLITIILELNPKLYFAFEKLYKILVDLLIFADDSGISQGNFYKVKSACIESALIDNNFAFAYKHSEELLDQFDAKGGDLNEVWLTLYQVGKYALPEWGDHSDAQLSVLLKQREILARTLKLLKPNESSIDNSRVILRQWNQAQDEISEWYRLAASNPHPTNDESHYSHTPVEVSEKLSNLFVSGLGWAIGANQSR